MSQICNITMDSVTFLQIVFNTRKVRNFSLCGLNLILVLSESKAYNSKKIVRIEDAKYPTCIKREVVQIPSAMLHTTLISTILYMQCVIVCSGRHIETAISIKCFFVSCLMSHSFFTMIFLQVFYYKNVHRTCIIPPPFKGIQCTDEFAQEVN